MIGRKWSKTELGIEKENIILEEELQDLPSRVEGEIDRQIQKKEYLQVIK